MESSACMAVLDISINILVHLGPVVASLDELLCLDLPGMRY
jgi:hypothetical protein